MFYRYFDTHKQRTVCYFIALYQSAGNCDMGSIYLIVPLVTAVLPRYLGR